MFISLSRSEADGERVAGESTYYTVQRRGEKVMLNSMLERVCCKWQFLTTKTHDLFVQV